jgi:hypothetical protein
MVAEPQILSMISPHEKKDYWVLRAPPSLEKKKNAK